MTGPRQPGSQPRDDLPVRRRTAARVLLLDPEDRVLLIHDSDQGQPGTPTWWITPGGGVDPGEDVVTAALRELREETGLVLPAGLLAGPVWRRREVVHVFSDHRAEQAETFFAARVDAFTPVTDGLTESERSSVLDYRWWTATELAGTDEDVWPRELAALLPAVLAGDHRLVELPDSREDPGGRP